MSSMIPGTLCGRSEAGPAQTMRSSWIRMAALLQTSVPVQSLPMFVNSRTVIVDSPAGRGVRRSGRNSGRHSEGHLLSIEVTDWVPADHRGVVGDRLTTRSNEPGDIGFVTVVHQRSEV